MQRRLFAITVLLLASALAGPVRAADSGNVSDPAAGKVMLAQGGGFAPYALPSLSAALPSVSALGNSGFSVSLASGVAPFGWRQGYRIDANVAPNLLGGYTAGVAAAMGVRPGEVGTSYGLKVGAGWIGEGLAGMPFGSSEFHETNDTAVSFSVTQSITPRLSFIGSAEAHHGLALNGLEPNGGASQVIVGAGIGLRF